MQFSLMGGAWRTYRFPVFSLVLGFILLCLGRLAFAQSAAITGLVIDPSSSVIPDVQISLTNQQTGTAFHGKTNGSGVYALPFVQPGTYTLTADFSGFKHYEQTNINVAVAQNLELDIRLQLGGASQSVTVNGSGIEMNTTDASVSTVINRQFVENIPLNGRSFQSLMTVIPGVSVVASHGPGQSGEITVNGQRTESNQFTVDGVSAGTGIEGEPAGAGAGFSGSVPGETVLGTTQSLVSIDALQEFRATTSTYSAEYGRTPGGQFTFNTRSGTNDWHGSLFDYFRNGALDANNWFNNYLGVPRLAERQNDFGGTLGGPIRIPHLYNGHDKTFFFFSYEGLRLQSPVAALTMEVPSLYLRQNAPSILKPFINAYPLPNGPESGDGLGLAYYTAGYSTPSSIDTSSIRIDHHFNDKFSVFGRYSDVPSSAKTRSTDDLAEIDPQTVDVKTVTIGATNVLTSRLTNEFRANGTWNDYGNTPAIDSFGGATAMTQSSSGAPGITSGDWIFFYMTGHGTNYPGFRLYPQYSRQRQLNITDKVNASLGRHQFKWGIDYRRLASNSTIPSNYTSAGFDNQAEVLQNDGGSQLVRGGTPARPAYTNFSAFLQDEWKVNSRLNLSLGVRWDINPAPKDAAGNDPYTVDQITNLATTRLAPQGTPLWQTTHANFAPRFGLAYQISQQPGHETTLRAGAGMFYDTGNVLGSQGYQFGVGFSKIVNFTGDGFPLTLQEVASVGSPDASSPYTGFAVGFNPNLKQPYTWQWNVALEHAFGEQQTLTISYVASDGVHLLNQIEYDPSSLGNLAFSNGYGLYLTQNQGESNYQALQAQFQRKLSRGLQILTSYTWAHAIDNATSNFTLPELERGSSDYDIRHNFQLALTYDIPSNFGNRFTSSALSHWSIDLRTTARSALPVDVYSDYSTTSLLGSFVSYHPNRVAGMPLYVHDGNAPGGRSINYEAYSPAYAADGVTLEEGNAGRNSARGFDAVQQDIAVRRDFHFTERVGMQFRVEAFNLINHPMFGTINNYLSGGATGPLRFGIASNTLNGQLGGLNTLYQVGGPRSLQLALKLHF